ncbi:MAG: Ig-like domain-containing protein [Candidatus Omnitrophota bacterium]
MRFKAILLRAIIIVVFIVSSVGTVYCWEAISVSASPNKIPADGSSTSIITAMVYNIETGVPTAGVYVYFNASRGSVSNNYDVTNSSGYAFTTFTSSTSAGYASIMAMTAGSTSAYTSVRCYSVTITTPGSYPVYMGTGGSINLAATVIPGGVSGTYSWSQISGPGGGTFTLPCSANTEFSAGIPGYYAVRVEFSAGGGSDEDISGDIVFIKVELETYAIDILRSQQESIRAFIEPAECNLSFQTSGYNTSQLEVNYNSALRQFDFTNLIEESDLVGWADEQIVEISSILPVINVGPVRVDCEKKFNKSWDNLKKQGIGIANNAANDIGDRSKLDIENKLRLEDNHDPEFPRYLSAVTITRIGDVVRDRINNGIVDIVNNVFGSVPASEAPQTVVPESTVWVWSTSTTLNFGNLNITVPGDIDYTSWFNSIIDYGFDAEYYQFSSSVADLTFNVSGPTVTGQWGFNATTRVRLDKGTGNFTWQVNISFDMDF